MLITLCLLLGLQTEIILIFSPGHLLFSKNRFSLASVLTSLVWLYIFTVNRGRTSYASANCNHMVYTLNVL